MTVRKAGGRYRKFRARILMRDPTCTEPGCRGRSIELHHDPPFVEGGRELHPDDARGVCGRCHRRLTAEMRERLGLPWAPRNQQRSDPDKELGRPVPARALPHGKGPPKQWIGKAMLELEVTGLAEVHYHDGLIVTLRSGERYRRDR